MSKHRKPAAKGAPPAAKPQPAAPPALAAHPPVRQPTLLAVSIVLFVLWFVFLLVTALGVL